MSEKPVIPALKRYYLEKVVPELMSSRGYANIHQVPAVTKVVINSGIKAESEKSWPGEVAKELSSIAGQKAVVTKARQSVSNFKVRKGMPLGAMVTLRGPRMWEFLYRLIAVTLPNIRDFRGVSRKLDGRGNYSLGITDHSIFPEITVDTNRKNIGLDITIVTTAPTDDEGRELLRLLGMPFRQSTRPAATKDQPAGEPAQA